MSQIEIIGTGISILLAVIVALISKGKNRKVDWGITSAWLLIGLLVTSHLNQREIINKNAELLNLYGEFKNSPSTIELARNEIEAKKSLSDMNIQFFQRILNQKHNRYQDNMQTLSSGAITYNTDNLTELGEMYNDVIEIFQVASPNSKIRATSYVNVEQWWTNEFGEDYKKANNEAIERGVELTRIWIFKTDDDFKNSKPEMTYQKETLGVNTYFVYERDIQDLNESKIDVLLVDNNDENNSLYGELELTPLRKMISVSFGSNKERMNELNNYWDNLIEVAKKF
ncbi:MAG: hypothetical protein WD048_15265 [Chitinophagales bacterium]